MTFIVTKPIINGISTTSQSLVKVAGHMGSAEPISTTTIPRVVIRSGLITVPDRRTFNRGDKINIEFGDLPESVARLDGTNYSKSVPMHVVCEGGSFGQGALNINLGIQTTTASDATGFDGSLLGTLSSGQRRDNLGIMLKNESGSTIMPNQFYNMKRLYQDQSDWNLTAAPVTKPDVGDMKEGGFEASITVIARFR